MFSIFCLYSRNVLHVKHNTFRTRWMKLSGYSQDKKSEQNGSSSFRKLLWQCLAFVRSILLSDWSPHPTWRWIFKQGATYARVTRLRYAEGKSSWPPLWRKAIRTCFPIKGRCYAGNDAISSVLGRTSISVSHSNLAAIWSLPEASHLLACAVLQITLQRSQWW